MAEWWTYTLADFLLFSPRTYWRTVELYNAAIWPLQLAGLALGAWMALWLLTSRGVPRWTFVLLAASWLWIAWSFHYARYAQINWAAPAAAIAFAAQALLLAAIALLGTPVMLARKRVAVAAVVAFTVVGYPLLAPLAGRTWVTAEAFGTAATPTAIATLALAGVVRGRKRWWVAIVPLAWCVVAAATAWAMDEHWEALVVAALAALGVSAAAATPAAAS
ncbi:MAG: hypothetical protein IT518_10695 [Burkholderiales bacterium]|nr:hypothetical protein [Burkholderiales bacterium]